MVRRCRFPVGLDVQLISSKPRLVQMRRTGPCREPPSTRTVARAMRGGSAIPPRRTTSQSWFKPHCLPADVFSSMRHVGTVGVRPHRGDSRLAAPPAQPGQEVGDALDPCPGSTLASPNRPDRHGRALSGGPEMTCPRCQAEHDAAARFCEDCGAPLEHTCPRCGAPTTAGKKFCRSCGASLATRFEAPDRYTPKHLADKIITSKSALEGERKQVTVLFADLKGSLELLAERDPEEARSILDPVIERMMEAVHRYEGTVNLVMGDGIMALFGAPVAHEDHAVRACYAALRMQDAVKRYAAEARESPGIPVQIRVGLNAGEVLVGSIGNDLRMDYTAIGRTTHLAARMEQMAPPGSILITADTLRLAEGFAEVKPLGPMAVKGLSEPVEVYEVTGATAIRSRFRAAAARGLTRFVGRHDELQQLGQALELARTGRGQVVAVVGEPGVGKSRLIHEL